MLEIKSFKLADALNQCIKKIKDGLTKSKGIGGKMEKEKKIKEKREEILQFLKEEKITASDWKDRIVNFINQKYEQCTLQ